jgi:hypothetical protein
MRKGTMTLFCPLAEHPHIFDDYFHSFLVKYCTFGDQATSRGLINQVATTMMIHDLGGSSSGLLHLNTGISVGQISLALGLLIASIGVLTGDAPEPAPGSRASKWPSIARLTAVACLVIGLIYFFISYGLFL